MVAVAAFLPLSWAYTPPPPHTHTYVDLRPGPPTSSLFCLHKSYLELQDSRTQYKLCNAKRLTDKITIGQSSILLG
jgi:hypothetical protein